MFGICGWNKSRKDHIDRNSKHYAEVQKSLSEEEQVMLELIYADLALRNKDKLLTYENFQLFFGLTGLWGAKLFKQFDEDGRKLISKEQFFYGLSRTAKAAYIDKVKLLFNFFKDDEDNGIKLSDFTKMLYNYSRDELKQILVDNIAASPELSKQLQKRASGSELSSPQTNDGSIKSLIRSTKSESLKGSKVIEFDFEESDVAKEDQTTFGRKYARFSEYKDPGTILELKMNDFTYKVNYCNMRTLVKQFANNIFKKYKIHPKMGIFNFEEFQEWIKTHNKLFQSYYTSFHINLWTYFDGEPNFLSKLEKSFDAKMMFDGSIKKTHVMLVGDILIFSDNRQSRKAPTKVVCLDGLNMEEVRDQHGFGIRLEHRDQHYPSLILYLKNKQEQMSMIDNFRLFEGDTLYDLYDVHQSIGTGKFSIVYRCVDKETGKIYALKDISTDKLTAKQEVILDNESEIMKILEHPQIVKYNTTIRSKEHIYIIAQYVYGRDLYEYVKKRGRLSEYISAFIIGKIIEAVTYLHSLEIIHRDIKPENIMVMFKKKTGLVMDDAGDIENIKIIDFGLANHEEEITGSEKEALAGTPNYIAPETIMHNTTTCKSDIFSIGSILYFLLSGKMAFAYKNVQYTLLRTARGEYDLSGEPWNHISEEAVDLMNKLLDPNPDTRIGLQEALNHKWFDVVTGNSAKKGQTPKKMKEMSTSEWDNERSGSLDCERVSSLNFEKIGMEDIEFELSDKEGCKISPFKL